MSMLSLQGRVQFDLLLYNHSKTSDDLCFLIECDGDLKDDFIKTIKRFKIRRKVHFQIALVTE